MTSQQPVVAVQNVLPLVDVHAGTTLLVFVQTISGSIFKSVAQSVFHNKLREYTVEYAPGLYPAVILGTGATAIRSTIPAQYVDGVRLAYNNAFTRVMLIPAVIVAVGVIFGFIMEWRSVKKDKEGKSDVDAASEVEPRSGAGKGKHEKSTCA